MTIQQGKKLYPECIGRGAGFDIYKVVGSVYQFTDSEIINTCDANNWGGLVYMRSNYYAEVKVYTD